MLTQYLETARRAFMWTSFSPDKLADYLISECDNFNFNNQTSFDYVDFLEAYLTEHPQYKEDIKREFKGLLAIDEVKTTLKDFGNSVKRLTIKATEFNYEAQKAKYNNNQKWYNNLKPKRKRK